jgi:hypothetical protein
MLSWSHVLQRIKEEIGFPFQYLEKSDEEIIDYCKRNALKKYDTYFPQKWRITIDSSDETIKVPNRTSEYYILDPEQKDIFGVTEFITDSGPLLMTGHPYIGAFTFGELENYSLMTNMANNTRLWSPFNYQTEFIYPNTIRITPKWGGRAVIEYERQNDLELTTINPDRAEHFVDLCLGMLLMMIGRIRKRYNPIQTPFGEIQISGDDMYNEGKEICDRILELFKSGSLPNVIFDRG